MQCWCDLIPVYEKDLDLLNIAASYVAEASSSDAEMTDKLEGGKGLMPTAFTADKQGEIDGAVDEMHKDISDKLACCADQIAAASERVQERLEFMIIDDAAFHEAEAAAV